MAKTPSSDRNPKTKPGVTGFVQDYNDQPPPTQDLNPDAVTEDSVLPPPQSAQKASEAPTKARKTSRARKPRG